MKAKKKKIISNKQMLFFVGLISILMVIGVGLFVSYLLDKPGEFNSLKHISDYTHTIEEYPMIDNTNWYNPDYSSHYKSQVLSFFDKVLIAARIKKDPEWAIELFDTLINQVAEKRVEHQLSGACMQAVIPQEGDRFFVWTDLQGSLHSFVRCLEYLKEHEVITDSLELKEGCHLVFNGNALEYGPYILQTFTLILQLMHKNPKSVFFVRSYYEQPGGWYDSTLSKALRIFAKADSNEVVPYASEVDAFLETVPDVLYLLQKEENKYQAIEIAFAPEAEDKFIRECGHVTILDAHDETHVLPYDKKGFIDGKDLNIRALVVKPDTPKRMLTHPDGLIPVGMRGATFKWVTFSSPNGRSHQIYQFFYDTIIEINTTGPIDQWTISEHRNDVRDALNFELGGTYYLVNGLRPGDQERIAKIEKRIEETKKELEAAKHKCKQEENNLN